MNREQILSELVVRTLTEQPVEDAVVCLDFIFGNATIRIPNDHWHLLVLASKEPCGETNCQCYVNKAALFEVLNEIRKEAKGIVGLNN